MGNYQLLEDEAGPGALQNVVELTPFLKVRAGAECEPDQTASNLDRTTVRINYARVEVFNIRQGVLHGCVIYPLHVPCQRAGCPDTAVWGIAPVCRECCSDASPAVGVSAELGTFCCRIPLPLKFAAPGYIEWLYLDEDLRITKGNKGSYFIHTRY